MMFRVVIVAAALACVLAFPALAKTLRWNCVYTVVAKPEGVSKEEFELEFVADDITGKAVLVGNMGVSDVDTHVGSYGVTFMEKLETGVVQTTTIANSGASVHSRHTIFLDKKIIPTQFYGQCKLVQ